MTRTVLVAGTASHVGKSTVAAGLCRLLARRGVDVAPFKGQNMSNNARVALKAGADRARHRARDEGPGHSGAGDELGGPDDEPGWEDEPGPDDGPGLDDEPGPDDGPGPDDVVGTDDEPGPDVADPWGEIGVSQWVQARAAGVVPTTDHNPVLLKPRGDGESQLVVHGEVVEDVPAGDYYTDHWARAREAVEASYRRIAADHDVVVAEGAGSIAEINLHDRDLANVETVRIAERVASASQGVDVLLLVDIERGGAFASLYGTLALLPGDLRERVVGAAITKFRGDRSLLSPGIAEIEDRTGVPVVGVLPYDDPGLPEEDSVALPAEGEAGVRGADDGVPTERSVTVAVPRLPRISNATDLAPLARVPGVRVAYVPPTDDLAGADAVVLPGTKNTVDDLVALREADFGAALGAVEGPVVGLCGGYQIIGERITNASVEGTGDDDVVEGFGLLPVETRFSAEKRVARVERRLDGVGPLAGAAGTVTGYEIHMGDTEVLAELPRPLGGASVATDRVLGTYVHGLFENRVARDAFVERVFAAAGRDRPAPDGATDGPADGATDRAVAGAADRAAAVRDPYERAADLVAEHLDLATLGLSYRTSCR